MADCDNITVDLAPVDFDVTICATPAFDVEIVQPDITLDLISVAGSGPKGDKGDPGQDGADSTVPGPPGATGMAATISVGATITGAPGTLANVNNRGSSNTAVLDFTIPRGDVGPPGEGIHIKGTVPDYASLPTTGQQIGDLWVAEDTSHGWAWDGAGWTDTGPLQGPPGTPGTPGTSATATAGNTTTGNPGTSASVNNVGTLNNAVFDFAIPRGAIGANGATGAAATIVAGPTVTGLPGTSASVTNTGTSSAAIFAFTIPRGDVGSIGPAGSTGSPGSAGPTGSAAWTLVSTSSFTVPAYGGSVTIHVADTSWVALNEWIYIDDAGGSGVSGQLVVTAKTANTLTLFNPSPTSGVPGPAGPTGPIGPTGPAGTPGVSSLVTTSANGLVPATASVALRAFRTNSSGLPNWYASDFTNVVLYGADPSNSIDSTAAIQNAANAMTSGGVLFFPAGTYKVSSTLTFSKSGTYLGSGKFSTAIMSNNAAVNIVNLPANSQGMTIRGIQFNSSVTRTGGYAILDSGNGFNVIDECAFSNSYISIGLAYQGNISYPQMDRIHNCWFSSNSNTYCSIYVDYCTDLNITDCLFLPAGSYPQAGILLHGVGDCKISRCEFSNQGKAIWFINNSGAGYHIEDVRIDHCVIDSCFGGGIILEADRSGGIGGDIRSVIIDGCWIVQSQANPGITCYTSGGGTICFVQISNNQIFLNGNGILINDPGTTEFSIQNNVISGNNGVANACGILLGSNVGRFNIIGNTIGSSLLYAGHPNGIAFNSGCTNGVVSLNRLQGNTNSQWGAMIGSFVNTNNI